jgi:Zn-dependent protease with chaperone function
MDFFQNQQRAQTRTKLLVFYFGLAVVLIVAAVYCIFALAFLQPYRAEREVDFVRAAWRTDLFLYVAAGTVLVIGLGSLYRIMQLGSGGGEVARSLGGVQVNPNTRDPLERRLRNVVEEMAIASGVPTPDIYVLPEEEGINAFAAGNSQSDAAVAVTRGCLLRLKRDELQGVIAHEFSHILNGDMRLNVRLIGILFGILCLAIVGRILLQTRGRKNPLPLIGLGLLLVGGIGVFFGNLIKSAVSRQREFLADASAVQFTRNPEGLVGALKKIGGWTEGSQVKSARAEEASHMFFGNGRGESWFGLFATHPPLSERIRAIDPSFQGQFPAVCGLAEDLEPDCVAVGLAPTDRQAVTHRRDLVDQAGLITPANLTRAAAFHHTLSPEILAAIRTPEKAIALVCGFTLAQEPEVQHAQRQWIAAHWGSVLEAHVAELLPSLETLPWTRRLTLLEMAVPALRRITLEEYVQLKQAVRALTEMDQQITLHEYALQKVLFRHLSAFHEKARRPVVTFSSLKPLTLECGVLLSCLAHLGHSDEASSRLAFQQGTAALNVAADSVSFLSPEQCGLQEVDAALDRLNGLAPVQKRNLLYACADTVMADGEVTEHEEELLRAIAATLDCPLPPNLQ